jgi:HEAT repeat protein
MLTEPIHALMRASKGECVMAVPVLEELFANVPHWLAAGSSAAKSDARLRRHARSLRVLADSVPALGRLADAVERVCRASAEEAATAWLDLLVLFRQVRSGVMSSGMDGELERIPPSGPWHTTAPAEMICAAAQALASKGRGRDEAIRPLAEKADGADLRLLDGLLRQLNDSYADLADFIADRVLPHFGRPILAELRAGYDPRGGAAHGRRLLAITHIDSSVGQELALEGMKQGSPAVRLAALRALAVADPKAARRAAIEMLAGKANPRLRRLAVETLERVKVRDPEAASWLVQALADDDFYVSHRAQSLLESVGHAAVAALIALLQGPDAERRRKAIWALRGIGADAAEAVPALVAALEDSTVLYGASIPQCAMAALAAIGPAAQAALPALMRFLESDDPTTRFGAAKALIKITGKIRPYLPVLIEALSSSDIHLRLRAAEALEQIGPPAKAAGPTLIKVLKDKPGNVRHFAASALGRIGCNAEEVVPLLIPMVNEREWYIRHHAIRALGYFGPRARAALPILREAAKDRAQYIQEVVGPALAAIENGDSVD